MAVVLHRSATYLACLAGGETLAVTTTHDGETVITELGVTPLLVADLWEQAYYLDHKNERASFLTGWWDRLANWSFAERQFAAASGEGLY